MSDTTTADWSVLEIDGVNEMCEKVAAKLTLDWTPTFDYDDLYQEALIIVATKADEMREALDIGGIGVLHHRLWSDMTDWVRKSNRRLHLNTSYDAIVEGLVE